MTTSPASSTSLVVKPPEAIDSTRNWWIGIGVLFAVAVGITVAIAALTDEPANSGFVDGAAVLAFVTGIAIGIERIVEVAWARVDRSPTKGAWWPLSVVTKSLSAVEKDMNTVLQPLVANVGGLLTDLENWTGSAEEKRKALDEVTAQIKERAQTAQAAIANAQKLAPGSSRFAAIARAVDDFTHGAELTARKANVWSRDLERQLRAAGEILSSTQDVVGAFRDNAARKTMSIALGVPLGVLVSGVLTLNMFAAVLGEATPGYMVGVFGVLATGVVIGLGSNPTHEVIRALQRRRGDATIDVAVGSEVEVVQQVASRQRSDADATALADAVASLEGFDSDTIRNLLTVQQFMEQSVPQVAARTTYASKRRVRPIRNAG